MDEFIWITDPHYNRVTKNQIVEHFQELKIKNPKGIFLTGDISNGTNLKEHLELLADLDIPIYFCLGNHDIYNLSFKEANDIVRLLCKTYDNLFYLNDCKPMLLSNKVALIGQNGWYDARYLKPISNLIFAHDSFYIKDFSWLLWLIVFKKILILCSFMCYTVNIWF